MKLFKVVAEFSVTNAELLKSRSRGAALEQTFATFSKIEMRTNFYAAGEKKLQQHFEI